MKRRRIITAGIALAASIVAGAVFGAAVGAGGSDDDVPSVLKEGSRAPGTTPAGVLDLASAVNRWQEEADSTRKPGPGRPVVGRTAELLRGVGSQRDTVNAFPTDKGQVCFEIRAAGTCGELGAAGATYAILSTPGSTRVYGVVSDGVTRVQVNVNGDLHEATLQNSGYHYELARGTPRNAVKGLVTTWKDGSTRELRIALN